MSARVLVFGLDAGDPATARKLAADNRMPALARLLESGEQYPMFEERGGAYVAERWTTMVTGVGPETHRYYSWTEVDTESGRAHTAPLDPAGVRRLWDAVSDNGQRVAVIDVPRQPLAKVNGIHLVEWAAHDRDLGTCSWPPALAAELDERFGPYPLSVAAKDFLGQFGPCDVILRTGHEDRSLEQLRELETLVRGSLDVKAQASEHLLQSEPWDLFFTVIGESHCATHQFWHLHDAQTDRDRQQASVLGNVVTDTFERIDTTLARHVALAGPDCTVVVILHSGMAPPSGGNALLAEVLRRLPAPFSLFRTRSQFLMTMAYSNRIGTLRLQDGGGRSGKVRRSAVNDAARRLRTQLETLIDDDTGAPAVRAVKTREEIFPGLEDDALPDIFVEWNGTHLIRSVSAPSIGTIVAEQPTARTGDHTPEGLVIVKGPHSLPALHPPMDPVAFAPMIARLLGIEFSTATSRKTPGAESASARRAREQV